MAQWKKPTPEETFNLRKKLAERARTGDLRLPFAIKEIRMSFGMSQDKFASLVGVTKRQISEMENGTSNPTVDTINRIGRFFGFTVGFVPQTPMRSDIVERPADTAGEAADLVLRRQPTP